MIPNSKLKPVHTDFSPQQRQSNAWGCSAWGPRVRKELLRIVSEIEVATVRFRKSSFVRFPYATASRRRSSSSSSSQEIVHHHLSLSFVHRHLPLVHHAAASFNTPSQDLGFGDFDLGFLIFAFGDFDLEFLILGLGISI
ncbi:hypothetical protein QYF36_006300 [Acer negundo]|nr:hypothetical protein QYF36_006300 [Acer negundo]